MIIDVHWSREPQAEKLFKFDGEQKCRRRETSRKQLDLVSDCDGNNAGHVLYVFLLKVKKMMQTVSIWASDTESCNKIWHYISCVTS